MKLRSLFGMGLAVLAFAFTASAFAADFTYSVDVTPPTVAFDDGGYTANGSFTVTVTDDECSTGTYTINAAPVFHSAPDSTTPPSTTITTYIGFPEGSRLFDNAGVGDYTLTMTQTSSNTGCNMWAQEIEVVTVGNPPVTQWGNASTINNPPPAPVDMMDEPEEETTDTDETEPTETDDMSEVGEPGDVYETAEDDIAEVMLMDMCDTDTILAYQEALMNTEPSTEGNVYAEMLGNVLTQVKLLLNRYLDRAESEADKNDRVMNLICKIETVKQTRLEAEYSHIDYLLQFIQDIAVRKFVK
jgi:hypothetical protein